MMTQGAGVGRATSPVCPALARTRPCSPLGCGQGAGQGCGKSPVSWSRGSVQGSVQSVPGDAAHCVHLDGTEGLSAVAAISSVPLLPSRGCFLGYCEGE
jgi:hypothetical protein